MKRFLLLVSVIFSLAACSEQLVSTPAPTPQAIRLQAPQALQPWVEQFSACATASPGVALFLSPSSDPALVLARDEIRLWWGEPAADKLEGFSFQIGIDKIAIVVNQENALHDLRLDELARIFSGQMDRWSSGDQAAIQVWVYPQGDPTRTLFDQAVLGSARISTEAMLAPDPQAMISAISSDPQAIGYLPASWLKADISSTAIKIKPITLDSPVETQLTQPVIAMTSIEPQGMLRQLLSCVQSQPPAK